MPASQPEHAAIRDSVLSRDPDKAAGIANFARFVRGTDHAGLFAAG